MALKQISTRTSGRPLSVLIARTLPTQGSGCAQRNVWPWGTKGSAVVRALASHQCDPGSNPGVDAICGLSLLLALSLAPRGFSPCTPVFPSP